MNNSEPGAEKVNASWTTAAGTQPLDKDSRQPIAIASGSPNWWHLATSYGLYGVIGGAVLGSMLKLRRDRKIGDTAQSMVGALADYESTIATMEGTASILGLLIPTSVAAGATLALLVALRSRG